MKQILLIPIAVLILTILFIEMLILVLPLSIIYFITKKDYSKSWMVKWSEKPLHKCGIKV